MRRFSVRPALTLRGRKFKGPRGWAGKPMHPPLTDIPVAAYILGAAFDVIALVGQDNAWAEDFFHAGTYVFVGGAIVSVFAALTAFWDWWKSSEKGTQARRTINTHAWAMITVTVLVLIDIALRLDTFNTRDYPTTANWVLLVVVAALVSGAGSARRRPPVLLDLVGAG